jgi:hypothetical protein
MVKGKKQQFHPPLPLGTVTSYSDRIPRKARFCATQIKTRTGSRSLRSRQGKQVKIPTISESVRIFRRLFSLHHKTDTQSTDMGCTVREQIVVALVLLTSSVCPLSFIESKQEYRI